MNLKSSIAAIDKAGALLVFPLDNRKEPASIWSHFYPKEEMRWEWDDNGDNRVAKLWHLRSDLSTTRKVIYTKWFRGRATYLSRPLFSAMLRGLNPQSGLRESLSANAKMLLDVLLAESPLSTKELKRMSGLQGRTHERAYEKAFQELGSRLLIVIYGEVDDGAFPSIAVGSTQVLFEELWSEAMKMDPKQAEKKVSQILPSSNLFYRHYIKVKSQLRLLAPSTPSRESERPKKGKAGMPKVIKFSDL